MTACYMPDAVLGIEDTTENKTDKEIPAFVEMTLESYVVQ